MIAKIMNRVDFGGLVNYAHNDKSQTKRANLLAHEGVCITDNKTIADSFYVQAAMRPNRKKPVKHIALSFSPRDAERFPDNEEGDALMAEIAKEWLKRMEIVNTQFIIARHHDTKHPHCHIVYNIVDNDGNVLSDRNERYRSARICRALTEEYGLYIARKNSKEQNLNRLRPQQMKKAQLKTAVLDARQASNNWESFIAELSKRHIGMQTTSNKLTGKVVGLSFSLDETHSAGSRLDSSLSYSNLCVFFGQALEELIFLPHVQATECGGGPTNSQGWRDKDEDKDKWKLQQQTKHKPSKRRR
mgnify:FL=1